MSRLGSIFSLFPQLWRTIFSRPITVRYPFGELELPPYFRGRVVLDESKCVGCGLCVRDCPGFGLVLERTPDKDFSLVHHPDRCANCGQCEDNCRSGAIRLTNEFVPATGCREDLVEVLVESEGKRRRPPPAPSEWRPSPVRTGEGASPPTPAGGPLASPPSPARTLDRHGED